MHGKSQMSGSQGSKEGTKRRGNTKKYFSVRDDFQILEAFKAKGGMVHSNEIVQDLALTINREPTSISQRYKKLNGLCEVDKKQITDYAKNKTTDPLKTFVFFAKPPSKRIETITDMHPSKYFAMNTNKGNLINPDIDPEEENNQYYDNQVFEQTADDFENRSSQYHKTIGKTLEEKLRECKPISNPDMAFGSLLPPGGNYYGSLGKRADGAHDEEGEGEEPFKVMVSESQPFGVLNENTLDDRRILPKHDKEKNIIITPKTKEEVEGTKKFFNDMLENLAKTHNMKVEDVLKFTLELKCDVFCFENIHQALLKAAENNDKINEGQTKQARITNNQIMPSPIR